MARRTNELAFTALSIEGALLAPDFLNRIAHLEAAGQGEADYDIPRGLKLRDEIGRYWKIAENLWQDFAARRARADRDPFTTTAHHFLAPFCRQVLGFGDIRRVGAVDLAGRSFPVGWAAADGRVPLIFAGHDQPLDKPGPRHGDGSRRRSPFQLAQEYLNAHHASLWALVGNGLRLRVLRDNPSLTRPAYVEADLEAIFSEGLYPDFTALWLFAHVSRFGQAGAEPADCLLESWRNAAQLDNHALLSALFGLCFFRDGAALSRVNYRDMDSEELGSVYESLLELVPEMTLSASVRRFGFIGDAEAGSSRGNARKLTGSYYTSDSLVQELIKSALDPVIARTLADNPQAPVRALLELTVCDPACGSGHFLLAAARRIAEEVARLSATDGNPLPADYRHALRDVVAHCILGVDKNPMAVELARTALWLEAYSPDRALNFLDHHLRCGDALLGVLDPAVLAAGIPDKAFDALSGDDREAVKALKKANRDARKAIDKARAQAVVNLTLGLESAADAAALDALPDATLAEQEAKRAAFADAEAKSAASRARLAADIFVAAFVLPKTAATQATVPTSQDLWLVMNGGDPRPGVAKTAGDAARSAQAFHWWQAFPQVRAKGGFAVLLGNRPWERIKLQEEEFFASRSPLVAEAPHKAERARGIELLREGRLLHVLHPEVEAAQGLQPPNAAERKLHADFLAARRSAEAASLFAHDAGRYPLTGVGDVNTYALFAESFAQLVAETGRAGFIVRTGIATDDSTKAFFADLTQIGRLASLYDLENRERLFPAVDSRMKFCLLTLGRAAAADFVCFATQVAQLADPRRRFRLTPDEFRLINPNHYSASDLAFIVPRVLELSYTAHDLAPWAADLGHAGPPFASDPARRAVLRAELDACYARLYGLSRDELRYILDPADIMGADYPSETFRVLKNNEPREFGEYRTRRLVLEAGDRLAAGGCQGNQR